MQKVIVLGAGLVGKEVAKDLSTSFEVTSADFNQNALSEAFKGFSVKTICRDLSSHDAIMDVVAPYDFVVNALPGFMGYSSLKAVIEAGKNVVDIAFSPEDFFTLDSLAHEKNVTAIVDCGVAPGMSNVLLGYHHKKMLSVERYECIVGGLPTVRTWPFEYKAVFSPCDVIEEYTRPARYIENGAEVVRPALSDTEFVEFDGVGTLESFNSDGLRSLAKTINCPNMKEKTLRYPGHARFMEALREAGFFDKKSISIKYSGGQIEMSPLDFTSSIMFPKWKLKKGEEEFTAMRVTIEGTQGYGRREVVTYHLLDRYDKKNSVTSMARTTGYTCTGAVHLLAKGLFSKKGVCPPEFIGESEACTEFLLAYLKERGIIYNKTVRA